MSVEFCGAVMVHSLLEEYVIFLHHINIVVTDSYTNRSFGIRITLTVTNMAQCPQYVIIFNEILFSSGSFYIECVYFIHHHHREIYTFLCFFGMK